MKRVIVALALSVVVLSTRGASTAGSSSPTIDRFLAPGTPIEIVSARKAERLAWTASKHRLRNVYTAAGPAFAPVRLTNVTKDDGIELSELSVSDAGAVVAFMRVGQLNRDGWVANPTANPAGSQRAIWTAQTSGGGAWKLGEGTTPALSPDGSKFAFVSHRVDHQLIGISDVRTRAVKFLAPGVDHDSSPTWSPDGKRVAFIRRAGTPFGLQAHQGAGGIGNPDGPAFNPLNARRGGAAGRGGRGRGGAGRGRGPASGAPLRDRNGLFGSALGDGYTLAFVVADVATSEGKEFWHNQKDDRDLRGILRLRGPARIA